MRRGITSSSRHCKRAYRRWTADLAPSSAGATNCGFCRAFVPSTGAFPEPIGVCANAASPHDHAMVPAGHCCECFAQQTTPPQYVTGSFARATHERWTQQAQGNREGLRRDSPCPGQCGGCAFLIPLDGAFIDDWGTCANPASLRDGQPVFEHDGCNAFEENALGWGGATPRAALRGKDRPRDA